MKKIIIGKIVNAVALKGEVKVYPYSEPARFSELTDIYVGEHVHKIENVRCQGNTVVLKLSAVGDRNAAEALKGLELGINEADLPELPADTYYVRDMIGMDVIDADGTHLGTVKDIIKNTAQDLYEIERENGKPLLVPGVKEFILDVDLDKREVRVTLPKGLLELQ